MTEIIDLLVMLSHEIRDLKTRIDLIRASRANRLQEKWIDGQDVMQTLHISPRTLQTLRSNGTLPYSKIRGKFYYKVSDLENLLQENYYNPNFKCDVRK